jgi:hypothetical protein
MEQTKYSGSVYSSTEQKKGAYLVLKAPTNCRVWGRVFLGSLSLAFYYAKRLIRTQNLQDTSGIVEKK